MGCSDVIRRPVIGQKVRIYKPGMPDDGHVGKVLTAGVDGCWVRDVYTSATWYGYEQLVWDGESLGRTRSERPRQI